MAPVSAPDFSVVIVSWNTRDHLAACLASVAACDPAVAREVCVVDNGSTDGSADLVEQQYPGVRLIRNSDNRGFAAAVNQGLAATTGRWALLFNPDARLPGGALTTLRDWGDSHPTAGIIGAALRDPNGATQKSVAGIPSLATELLNRDLIRWFDPAAFPDDAPDGEPVDVPSVIGACLCARREAIAQIGPLDEGYFVFLEETDWCVRMREGGWRVVHHPGVVVEHAQGASKAHAPTAGWIEYYRSLYRFFRTRRSRLSYLLLRILRPLKLGVNWLLTLVVLLLTLGTNSRSRRKIRVYSGLLWWHLLLCPASMGLRGAKPRSRR